MNTIICFTVCAIENIQYLLFILFWSANKPLLLVDILAEKLE